MEYDDRDTDGGVAAKVREENQWLRNRLARLESQVAALAQANAHAAELVVQMDQANGALQREVERGRLADVECAPRTAAPQLEDRLHELECTNAKLTEEVATCLVEEQEQAALLQQLEDANRELTEFAYVVSHDLRAPLRGIKILAGWIVEDHAQGLDPEGRQQLDLLVNRTQRMESLIEGILSYSRAGRARERQVDVELGELLPSIVDMLSPPPGVRVTLPEDLPTIRAEPARVTQVFQNLIGNALKYLGKPEGRITVGWEDQGDRWVFRVTDDGPGIDPKHHQRIFKVFQTLAPRDETESTGIGLAVVRKVVSLYGGEVWLESRLGQGSTFYFSWPKHCSGSATEVGAAAGAEEDAHGGQDA